MSDNKTKENRNLIDLLLSKEPAEPQEAEFEIPRLTKHFGTPFVLELKEIGYNRMRENFKRDNSTVHDILDSVTNIDFRRSEDLWKKYNTHTPVDCVEKIFTAGEIAQIGVAINTLNGYGKTSVQEVKKN